MSNSPAWCQKDQNGFVLCHLNVVGKDIVRQGHPQLTEPCCRQYPCLGRQSGQNHSLTIFEGGVSRNEVLQCAQRMLVRWLDTEDSEDSSAVRSATTAILGKHTIKKPGSHFKPYTIFNGSSGAASTCPPPEQHVWFLREKFGQLIV